MYNTRLLGWQTGRRADGQTGSGVRDVRMESYDRTLRRGQHGQYQRLLAEEKPIKTHLAPRNAFPSLLMLALGVTPGSIQVRSATMN